MLDLSSVSKRFGLESSDIVSYLRPGEQLINFGNGGSESLVMFIKSPQHGNIVRKVCSELLTSVKWDLNGTGVMAPPSTKGRMQVDYLQGLPEQVKSYFPLVYETTTYELKSPDGSKVRRLIYDQSLLKGVEVSSFIADRQPAPAIVARLHREVMALLAEKIHIHRRRLNLAGSVSVSHLDKMVARLDLSRRTAPRLFSLLVDSDRIIINGQSYRNINELLSFFRQPEVIEMLEPKYHSLVMGDSNTENVMITNQDALLAAMEIPGRPDFTYDDIGLKFMDPRAIGHDSWGKDTVDDHMYDNKPIHNTLAHYDIIHGEYFSIKMTQRHGAVNVGLQAYANTPFSAPYNNLGSEYFKYVMSGWGVDSQEYQEDNPNWLLRFAFIMGTHFVAMPPFHFNKGLDGYVAENPESQKRAIAGYCEGIKWLNKTYEMIINGRQELYGMVVPNIKLSGR